MREMRQYTPSVIREDIRFYENERVKSNIEFLRVKGLITRSKVDEINDFRYTGTLFYSMGEIFNGTWKESVNGELDENGQYPAGSNHEVSLSEGSYTYPAGSEVKSFKGSWLYNLPQNGELTLSNGDVYNGNFGSEINHHLLPPGSLAKREDNSFYSLKPLFPFEGHARVTRGGVTFEGKLNTLPLLDVLDERVKEVDNWTRRYKGMRRAMLANITISIATPNTLLRRRVTMDFAHLGVPSGNVIFSTDEANLRVEHRFVFAKWEPSIKDDPLYLRGPSSLTVNDKLVNNFHVEKDLQSYNCLSEKWESDL